MVENLQFKGREPTKKCVSYIKRMITGGNWKPNEKLPPIIEIAERLSISSATVRKVVKGFERYGVIENFGSLGFYLLKPNVSKKKNLNLLKLARCNIEAGILLSKKGKQFRNWIVRYDTDISALDIVSGNSYVCSLNELIQTIEKPVTLEELLTLNGSVYNSQKKRYKRQQKLRSLARIVLHHKKELGINV